MAVLCQQRLNSRRRRAARQRLLVLLRIVFVCPPNPTAGAYGPAAVAVRMRKQCELMLVVG